MKKHAFYGVHPKDMKHLSNKAPVEVLPVKEGEEFFISLRQNIGTPPSPLVKKGQEVIAGELIAEANGFISAKLHAPVNGTVASITTVDFPVYGTTPCIVIKASADQADFAPMKDLPTIGEIALSAGLVGMGGAMFPSHVKLTPKNRLHTLIVNGAECEPYLTCDHRLMLERAEDLLDGIIAIKEALGLEIAFIGIESNKQDAVNNINSKSKGQVEVIVVPTMYPQGGEKQLILSITGNEVPDGKLPSDIGVLVHNVSTILALQDAIKAKTPLIKRVVTVTGDVVNKKNILTPIGTPISRLIDFCGGFSKPVEKVILGGPMTGFTAHSLNIPSYKGMNGIIALSSSNNNSTVFPCIRCGKCLRACPSGLSPVMLENYYRTEMFDEMLDWNVLSCIECGACNYVCPSNRLLKNVFKLGKNRARNILADRKNNQKMEERK